MTEQIETIVGGFVMVCLLIWWVNLTLELLFDFGLVEILLGTLAGLMYAAAGLLWLVGYTVVGLLYAVSGLLWLVGLVWREREPEPYEELNDDWLRANHPEIYEENDEWLRANDPDNG